MMLVALGRPAAILAATAFSVSVVACTVAACEASARTGATGCCLEHAIARRANIAALVLCVLPGD